MLHLDAHRLTSSQRNRRKRRPVTYHASMLVVVNLLALFSVCVGLWLSMASDDWQWFSRSGCLLVVLGIVLTSSQLIENNRRLKLRRHHHESNFRHDFAEEYEQHRLSKASLLEEDIWAEGLRGFYLLIIGTLIWGFGDLLGWLF